MKVIDLINMKDNGEDLPKKMIINKRNFHSNIFRNEIYEEDCNTDIWLSLNLRHIHLADEVKIIKEIEEPEEIDIQAIEELDIRDNYNSYNKVLKINKLIKAVKQLDRKLDRR